MRKFTGGCLFVKISVAARLTPIYGFKLCFSLFTSVVNGQFVSSLLTQVCSFLLFLACCTHAVQALPFFIKRKEAKNIRGPANGSPKTPLRQAGNCTAVSYSLYFLLAQWQRGKPLLKPLVLCGALFARRKPCRKRLLTGYGIAVCAATG